MTVRIASAAWIDMRIKRLASATGLSIPAVVGALWALVSSGETVFHRNDVELILGEGADAMVDALAGAGLGELDVYEDALGNIYDDEVVRLRCDDLVATSTAIGVVS